MFKKRSSFKTKSYSAGVAMNDESWSQFQGSQDKYLKEPAILTAVKLIVSELGSLPLKAFDNITEKEIGSATHREAFKILKRKPNAWQTTADFIRQLTLSMIVNRDTFILLNKLGVSNPVVSSMQILDNGTISIQKMVDGSFKLSGNLSNGKAINPADLIWIKSPLQSQGLSLDVLGYADTLVSLSYETLSNANLMVSRGPQSPGVIETDDSMSDEQFDSYHTRVTNTFKKSEVLILDGGMKWKENPNPLKDYEFDKNRASQIREIATLFGIPLPMLGIPDSAYKSYEEVRLAFHTSCLYPFMKQISDALEEAWNYRLTIRFDADEYAAVPLAQRVDLADKMVKLGSFDLNESRIAVGKAPRSELVGVYATETNNLTLGQRE